MSGRGGDAASNAAARAAWTQHAEGLRISVRLTPKSSRDGLDGLDVLADGRAVVKARVRTPPEDGRANQALIEMLAKALGAPKRDVTLEAGASARLKIVFVRGEAGALAHTLERLLGA